MSRRTLTFGFGMIVAAFITVVPAASASATTDLIDATPAEVVMIAPAPGEAVDWEMRVRNLTSSSLPVTLEVEGRSPSLFGGPHPLELTLQEAATGRIVYAGTVADALESSIRLEDLSAASSLALVGNVSLPDQAGNEYQAADATLRFEFTTMRDEPTRGDLATTGGTAPVALAVAAAALLAGGAGAFLLRRKEHTS